MKWEYKIHLVIGEDIYRLNDFGKERWELVSVFKLSDSFTNFYFKRPIKE